MAGAGEALAHSPNAMHESFITRENWAGQSQMCTLDSGNDFKGHPALTGASWAHRDMALANFRDGTAWNSERRSLRSHDYSFNKRGKNEVWDHWHMFGCSLDIHISKSQNVSNKYWSVFMSYVLSTHSSELNWMGAYPWGADSPAVEADL